MDVCSKKKIDMPTSAISRRGPRHQQKWDALFMFPSGAKTRGETGRSLYIFRTQTTQERSILTLFLPSFVFSLSLSLSLSLPLPNYAPPLVAIPQVVVPVRVIQDINAETDVGVDRRVSFSPFSWTDNLSQWCFLDPLSTHDVLGERRRLIRSRLINHAIN